MQTPLQTQLRDSAPLHLPYRPHAYPSCRCSYKPQIYKPHISHTESKACSHADYKCAPLQTPSRPLYIPLEHPCAHPSHTYPTDPSTDGFDCTNHFNLSKAPNASHWHIRINKRAAKHPIHHRPKLGEKQQMSAHLHFHAHPVSPEGVIHIAAETFVCHTRQNLCVALYTWWSSLSASFAFQVEGVVMNICYTSITPSHTAWLPGIWLNPSGHLISVVLVGAARLESTSALQHNTPDQPGAPKLCSPTGCTMVYSNI